MEFFNNLLSNENNVQQNLVIYITSIEEWEKYYIKMYDFQLILNKDNPKFNKIINLIKINKTYSFSVINNDEEYIIMDVNEVNFTLFNTVIKSITNDININTIIKTTSLSDVILKRDNRAYCGLYNELKLNIPCCLIINNKNYLIGISEPNIFSEKIKVKGLININIEFNHLNDYQEIVVMNSNIKIRIVFQKDSFVFKVGHNYTIKYIKMTEDYLFKIIESNEA